MTKIDSLTIIHGPTQDDIKRALFPQIDDETGFWLEFKLEGIPEPRRLALCGILHQGGGLLQLTCADGAHDFTIIYNPVERCGYMRRH